MKQFDVYINKHVHFHYVLNIQSDILSHLSTRLVIPLIHKDKLKKPISTLNPSVIIKEKNYFILTQDMASIELKSLGKKIDNLIHYRDDIIRATDLLITGF